MSGTTVQTRVQCNIQCNENSTRSCENLSVSKLYQNLTAINTAITVKLLTSKVTILNTCEKLKMSHGGRLLCILLPEARASFFPAVLM
jgi:hypothetical protein